MQPKSLSATGVQTYESCPARYHAEQIVRPPSMSGAAADLGTACHGALERYVADSHYKNPDLAVLWKLYDEDYWKLFANNDRYEEGKKLLQAWFTRTDLLTDRTVLSTEKKETFDLKFAHGVIPVTYIWDRCDELADGSIEVVDYKTVAQPIQPEHLKKRIQPRLYALAAAIKYPGRDRYWVSYDLLRFDLVGAVFTREENVETYRYLQSVAARIWEDDGTAENLNPECRFCIRRTACETLTRHVAAEGPLAIFEPEAVIDHRAKLESARAALDATIREYDEFLARWAEENEIIDGFKTSKTEFSITSQKRREIDAERAAKILPPDLLAKVAKLSITAVDALLKGNDLTPEQKSQIQQLIRPKFTAPRITTKPLAVLGEED